MTKITNADQVLILLRAHLERAKRASKAGAQKNSSRSGPLERVTKLAATEGLSEEDVARALIGGLLAEEFGAEFAAEPRFQSLVEDVRLMIDRDENGRSLLRRAVGEIGA